MIRPDRCFWIPGSASRPRNDDASDFGRLPYFVYMLGSRRHGTLYVGVTNDLARRVYEHKSKAQPSFTSRYGIERLIWYETYERIDEAIAREKALKKWRRDWKVALIEEHNPEWIDLYATLAG